MSLAWSTVALLVLLLPGFLFFGGLTVSERFSRETAPKNPLAQLATVVFVSFLVHSLLYLIFGCPENSSRCIDTRYVLTVFQLAGAKEVSLASLGENLAENKVQILLYFFASAALGGVAGALAGHGVVQDWWGFRTFSQHRWVYLLNPGAKKHNLASATALADISNNGTYIQFTGGLYDFSLAADGRFSYVILQDPFQSTYKIGDGEITVGTPAPVRSGRLILEGEDLKMFSFSPYAIDIDPAGANRLSRELETRQPASSVVAEAEEMLTPVDEPVPGAATGSPPAEFSE